jgi:signal transduction histidine kinase
MHKILKHLLFIKIFLILIFYTSCKNNSEKIVEADLKSRFDELVSKYQKYVTSNTDSLFQIAVQMMQLADSTDDQNIKLQANISMAKAYEKKGDIEKARKNYINAYSSYKLSTDTNLILNLLNQYGLFFKNFGMYDSAIALFNEGEKIALKAKNENLAIMLSTNKAMMYEDMGSPDKAIQTYQKSLDYFANRKDSFNYAQTCRNIALVSMRVGLKENALKYFNKAIEINRSNNFQDELASDYMNMGIFYSGTHPDSSLFYYKKAESIFEKLGSKFDLLKVRFNYANVLSHKKQFDKAKAVYLSVLNSCIEQNIPFGIYGCYHQLGILEAESNNYAESLKYFEKAIETAKKFNFTNNLLLTYKEAFNSMLKSGFTDKIIELYDKYSNLDDSLRNNETNKNIIKYQTQYETEKREKENQLLKNENEKQQIIISNQKQVRNYLIIIILLSILLIAIFYSRFIIKKRANKVLLEKNLLIENQAKQLEQVVEQLKMANIDLQNQRDKIQEQAQKLHYADVTKNKIFFIIAHDLKNPFNTILGYSDLLKTDYYLLSDIERLQFIENIYNSAINTYGLLENLLNWALSQQGRINVASKIISLNELVVKGISPYLTFAEKKQIKIDIEIDENVQINTDVDTISTVIGNLVNNSIKFTHIGGCITIGYKKESDYFNIIIKDNGVGIPHDKLINIFNVEKSNASYGTANEKGSGLGLVLCKEFVELNNGLLKIESQEGVGTTVTISLPV